MEEKEKVTEKQIIITKSERPNSFETGKAGARWKIYFNDAEDLVKQLAELTAKGFEVWGKDETQK